MTVSITVSVTSVVVTVVQMMTGSSASLPGWVLVVSW